MNMRRAVVLIGLALFAASSAQAAAEPARDPAASVEVREALRLFAEWADAAAAYGKIPGMSVGFVADHGLVWAKGFGYADLAAKKPATPETIYGICSISKLFTSIALMQQRDAGKLGLEDPVSEYLPYVKLEPAAKDAPPLTVGSLLTHSSGLTRESAQPYWTGPDFPFPSEEEIVSGLASQKMLYPPERYFQYSNLGLALAGQVVAKVSGKEYESYVEDAILKPLGLDHTTPFLPETERGKLLATGYGMLTREGNRDLMPFYEARGMAPAAGFASNVVDLAAFVAWQFRLLADGGDEVLRASTLRDMQRVHWVDPDWKTTWGLGFAIYRQGDDTWVGHNGHCPGYFTSIRMEPRKRIGAVVLTNAMNDSPEKIAGQLLKIVGPALEEAKKAKGGNQPAASSVDLERFAGLYRDAWGETVIVPWKGGLAAIGVPTDDPLDDLTELKLIEGGTFRRVRKDSDDLGEPVTFETGADGKISRLLWFENYSHKVR